MTDDLTAQVRGAVEEMYGQWVAIWPNCEISLGDEGAIAGFNDDLAPRIAACMRAVEDAAWVRGQRGDVTAFGEERTWAAGLAALRGEP